LIGKDVDIAYGDAQLSRQGKVFAEKTHPGRMTTPWLMKEVVAHQCQFIRRDLLERFEGYDITYRIAADYAFFARAFWNGGLSVQKLPLVISAFDLGGLSSRVDQRAGSAQERKDIQRRYAPYCWYVIYHTYAAFNRMIGR
jgi:hypothetical protein